MKVSALLAALVGVGLFGTVACGDDDSGSPKVVCKGADIDTPACNTCADAKCCTQLKACTSTCRLLNQCMDDNDDECAEAETEEEFKTCFTQRCGSSISAWDQVEALSVCLLEQCADECGAITE